MAASSLPRRLWAEFVGTGLLVTVAVGSAICRRAAVARRRRLTTAENSTAIAVGLAVLILLFGPVSGAHFNPVVSLADWLLGRRVGTGNAAGHAAAYLVARVSGGIAGALLANVMFDRRILELSANQRITPGHLVGGVVATAGLIAVIFALARTGRAALSAAAVGAYIGAAYWWTSSTSFANPAVTMGRVFSDSFAGIAPDSAPVLAAALAKNPHDRFPRCSDFARALAEQTHSVGAPTPAASITPAPVSRSAASTNEPPPAAMPKPAETQGRDSRSHTACSPAQRLINTTRQFRE
jgi:glycerol uptake facilitator-like aquaporin